jgi:putative ABC transport system permease protein
VAIINESVSRELFGDESAIGRVIELLPGGRAPWTNRPGPLVIVGVASTIKDVGLNEIEFGNLYVPFAQMPAPRVELVVRAGLPAADVADPLRRALAQIDPAVPVTSVTGFDRRVANGLQGDRFNLLLISSFAAIALLLAAIGVYGLMSYSVEQATHDIGVRMALGAARRDILGLVIGRGMALAAIGLIAGVAAAFAAARLLSRMLFGVKPTDPVTYIVVALSLGLVALIACYLPARRAMRVDPLIALRSE